MELPIAHKNLLSRVLADIIQDFLELSCRLNEKAQGPLVRELLKEPLTAEAIHIHPSFSVDGRIVVVGNITALECWLYVPETGKIMKTKWPRAA